MGLSDRNTVIVIALIAVIAVGSGLVAFSLNVGDSGDDSESGSDDMKSIEESTVKLKAGASGADTAYFFSEEPDSAYPVYHGDHVDFDATEATDGLQEGVDYYSVSLDNGTATDADTHPVMEPGEYHYVVVDDQDQVHTAFGTVDIKGEVEEYKLDRDYQQLVTLPLDEKTTADSSDISTQTQVESGDNIYSPATSLRGNSQDGFETVQTATHTIEVQSGAMYLGDIDLGSVDSDANVSEAELASATVDGESVDALSNIDLTDHSLDRDVFGGTDDPRKATDEVVLTFRFEAESDLADGESIVSGISVSDIYDKSTSSLSITG
ncbi:hypothetical protein HT576_08740 [Haloterrigena sp. SYSU A121-1]|uniref:Uncharacterized protein n=1 Tax=Haloterrigena gelatinilytica TaxID=2741724 RepID=A0A8J8KF08_9EURY|nr:hypothetical protein [Haloterrigena gelatinilytica]NUB91106.1 hypothetical protein [Haloterrigena gelatinilytica]